MGAVVGMLGLGGGPGGTSVNVTNPTSAAQLAGAQNGVQMGLANANALQNQLAGQNGLANQTSVYNQLQGVANGTGPNPAQAMLAQSTGQNVAQQASLAAGQRGAASNVGLLSRQAAQQGSNAQQQAAGQAATMQANQSLGALGQLGGLANTQVANQIQGVQNQNQAQQNAQQQLLGAQQGYNAANAGIGGAQISGQNGAIGGIANSVAGGVGKALGLAQGGQVLGYADGGAVSSLGKFLSGFKGSSSGPGSAGSPISGQQSLNNGMNSLGSTLVDAMGSAFRPSQANSSPSQSFQAAQGGRVPAKVSPGEKYLPPAKVEAVKKGASPMKEGETIPGKPQVGGAKNSYKNDTVSKDLEAGGIVIPRSVTQGKDPERRAAEFVRAALAKGKR